MSPDQLRIANKLIQLLHPDGFRIERVVPLLAAVLFGEEDELIWVNAQNALNTPTPKAPYPSPEPSKLEGFVEVAFWKKDRSHNNIASHFVYERLCTYYQDYRKSCDTYVASYTTIVGPSGISKSFAVKQLCQSSSICYLHQLVGGDCRRVSEEVDHCGHNRWLPQILRRQLYS